LQLFDFGGLRISAFVLLGRVSALLILRAFARGYEFQPFWEGWRVVINNVFKGGLRVNNMDVSAR